ncbi:hypothetical protein C8F01DRAFT_1244634 [Mycena amicta]|nr:hypothetical protein C8F01DRAFT_1244634 [Mycena amicta]
MASIDKENRQPVDDLVAAMGGLRDIRTFRTDPNVASMRANLLMCEGEETVRAVEVIGIAKAVEARFRSTSHSARARSATCHAWYMGSSISSWFGEHECKADYRTFLLTHLDWVHKDTRLCPVTAYLQLILRNMPVAHWPEAAAATAQQQDASPLAFAWVWARSIGSQTADVAALVTMGCHVYRLMLIADNSKRWAARRETFGHKLFDEGIWAALGVAVQGWLRETNDKRMLVEPSTTDAEELQAMVKNAVDRLRKHGEQYAQLLGEEGMPVAPPEEREAVVGPIRALAALTLGKAEPPVPETILLALTDLATTVVFLLVTLNRHNMSLSSWDDLTRNCFTGGLSPAKWLSLCKLFLEKQNHDNPQATQRALSNSVLVLYRSFPGDPVLQEYLKIAFQSQLLSLAVFVSTLLSAARSTELHSPATLDMLCRIALDAHFSSGQSSADLADYDSPITVLNTLQDALALLRVAHELPMSHFHQLTTSASELVALLFSCVEISKGPPAECMALLADANAMLAHNSISQNVRQALETFNLTLSLGMSSFPFVDEAKASKASEAHVLHFVPSKNDTISSTNDTVSFSLTLNYLVTHRAEEFGAGSNMDPARLFVGIFRWNSWAPPVFYTQLLLSAFICLSETMTVSPLIWRSFIVGRLPSLLSHFEKLVHVDGAAPENWRGALQVAVTSVMRRSELLERCDRLVNHSASSHLTQHEALGPNRTIFRDLLRQLLLSGLLDQPFILAIDPNHSAMYSETQAELSDPEAFFTSRLSPEMDFDDARPFIERIWHEPQMHKPFSEVTVKRFKVAASSLDTETLMFLSRIFYMWDVALDMLAIHQSISELIFHALLCLQEFDCETVGKSPRQVLIVIDDFKGDPQTAVSHLGDVVLFIQSTLTRFHLQNDTFSYGGRKVSSHFVRSTAVVYGVAELSGEDSAAFNIWYKALFDRNSEGIEDTILRSVKPKTLLKISATLFSSAMRDPNIDDDMLNNSISYFTGPLLKWTLVGVLVNLTREIQIQGFSISTGKQFHVLRTLLLSSECPRPVKCLCGQGIIILLSDKRSQNAIPQSDATAMYTVVSQASNPAANTRAQQVVSASQILGYPRRAIREAIGKARASKAPSLDIDRCVKICGSEKFLRTLWSELLAPTNLGDTDVCTRIATFAVTMPRPLNSPPLMPIFFNMVLPNLISAIDTRQVGDQTVPGELLGSIVSSLLIASLHLDLAFNETGPVLGQASPALARRLAADLRAKAKRQSNVSKMILQRLSSPSIVTNFPVFKGPA